MYIYIYIVPSVYIYTYIYIYTYKVPSAKSDPATSINETKYKCSSRPLSLVIVCTNRLQSLAAVLFCT